ncbi:hypothetical protein GW750_04190 [bacterium]|nr:hypothetical protein [bacterium]
MIMIDFVMYEHFLELEVQMIYHFFLLTRKERYKHEYNENVMLWMGEIQVSHVMQHLLKYQYVETMLTTIQYMILTDVTVELHDFVVRGTFLDIEEVQTHDFQHLNKDEQTKIYNGDVKINTVSKFFVKQMLQ